ERSKTDREIVTAFGTAEQAAQSRSLPLRAFNADVLHQSSRQESPFNPTQNPEAGKRRASPTVRQGLGRGLLFSARYRYVLAWRRPGVELARPANFLTGILDHLFPLGNPAHGTRDRKQHGEHADRKAHRLERDAGIEIDVGIELLLDKIFVVQRDPLELDCDVKKRVVLDAH